MKSIVFLALLLVAQATVYFQETFDDGWESRWVLSTHKGADAGAFKRSAGKFYGDEKINQGLQTSQDARFYQISAKFDEFSNEGKDLVIQYSVKHEQNIDCGGGYLKLMPAGLNQKDFNGDSQYNIMFGPDICGGTKKTHAIFNYKGQNHLINKQINAESDELTHVYRLVVHPDNTYEVSIDGQSKASGSLKDDWNMLPPKTIKDPSKSKPADWVDVAKIPDPEDKKPEGWDDIPAEIADPEAQKPEDWDDELDGDWEVPTIPNPEYKGEWKARLVDNPDYKGPWEHPLIDNPEYFDDDNLYRYTSNAFVGIEVWQVKSGTIFDNFIITDSIAEADAFLEKTYKATITGEKAAKEKADEEARKAREAAEEARRAAEEAEEASDEKDEL